MLTESEKLASLVAAAQRRCDTARLNLRKAVAWLRSMKTQYHKEKMNERKKLNAAARKERVKQRVLERRAKGLCRTCGKQAAPSKRRNSPNARLKFCEIHQAKQLASQRKRNSTRKIQDNVFKNRTRGKPQSGE